MATYKDFRRLYTKQVATDIAIITATYNLKVYAKHQLTLYLHKLRN